MKIHVILAILLVLLAGSLHSQQEFRSGYVISLKGDTIQGEIDYRDANLMGRICRFKASGNQNPVEFAPGEILGFRFTDSKYYISREVNGNLVFLEYLIKAKINIYFIKDEIGDHYYLDTDENDKLMEIPYREKIKEDGEKSYLIYSTLHIGLLQYYMQDVPELKSRIEGIRKPQHNSLIKLAQDYHETVCPDKECLIYERRLNVLKIYPEPMVGITRYKDLDKLVRDWGMYTYFGIPGSNERFYMKLGVTRQIGTENLLGNDKTYKIPIQLQYIYSAKALRPRVGLGVNFYKNERTYFHTINFSGGLNYHVLKFMDLSLVASTDHTPNFQTLVFKGEKLKLISYSFQAGLFIKIGNYGE